MTAPGRALSDDGPIPPAPRGRAIRVALALPALVAFWALALAIAMRAPVPFPLEWQEPAMYEHAARTLAHEPVYVAPTVDFAPFPYPPLFHLIGAEVIRTVGPSLLALRLVSVFGLILALSAVMAARPGVGGFIGAGFVCAAYGWTGFWYDVARVDSLAMGLGAVGWVLALRAERAGSGPAARGAALAAGAFLALGVLAKQTQAGLALALLASLLVRRRTRRAGLALLLSFGLWLVPPVLWYQWKSDGWFLWTTLDLLRDSPWHVPMIAGFWKESWLVLGAPAALTVTLLVGGLRSPWTVSLGAGCAGLVAMGWAGRAHEGGFENTLMPVALASGVVLAHGGHVLLHGGTRAAPGFATATRWIGAAVIAFATLGLFEHPGPVLPEPSDRVEYVRVKARIDAVEGEVWQPVGAISTERPGLAHKMAIVDLAKSGEDSEADDFAAELRQALASKRFAAIVLEGPPRSAWGSLGALIEAQYRFSEPLGEFGTARSVAGEGAARAPLTPLTGAPIRPKGLWVPRR